MKKIIIFMLLAFTFVLPFFASDNSEEVTTTVTSENDRSGMEMGAYYTHGFNLASLSEYAKQKIGGGLSYEITFPFFDLMGASVRGEYYHLFAEEGRVNNWQNINVLLGAFVNVPIVTDIVLLRPELSYGVIINIMELEGKQSTYVDQIIEIGASFRFSHPILKDKGLSFELTPNYTIFPQKKTPGQNIGFRTGVIYEF